MSLLQGVLKSVALSSAQTAEMETYLKRVASRDEGDSDDESLILVSSFPGTPQQTRPSSPVSQASRTRPVPKLKPRSTDPLKAFPSEITQRIFSKMHVRDLASCSCVSRKWCNSQILNYMWFLQYRRDHFKYETSHQPGKWTRRQSKQNWRLVCGQPKPESNGADVQLGKLNLEGPTPRDLRELEWDQETVETCSKDEARKAYQSRNGRKAKSKDKFQGGKDRTGWHDSELFLGDDHL